MIVHEMYASNRPQPLHDRIKIITNDETARFACEPSIQTLFTQADRLTVLVSKRDSEKTEKKTKF